MEFVGGLAGEVTTIVCKSSSCASPVDIPVILNMGGTRCLMPVSLVLDQR